MSKELEQKIAWLEYENARLKKELYCFGMQNMSHENMLRHAYGFQESIKYPDWNQLIKGDA